MNFQLKVYKSLVAVDLRTKEGSEYILQVCKDLAWAEYVDARRITPSVHIVPTLDEEGGVYESPPLLSIPFEIELTPQSKAVISKIIKQVCLKSAAIGVCFMSEAWLSLVDAKSEFEKAQELASRGQLEKMPGRKEVVHMAFEHIAGDSGIHFAEIADGAIGSYTFEKRTPEAHGLFLDLLPNREIN